MSGRDEVEGLWAGFSVEIRDPGIVWVTFDRPEGLNGITYPMKRDFVLLTQVLQLSPEHRVLVLHGQKHFGQGDDISGAYSIDEQWARARSPRVAERRRGDELGLYGALRSTSQPMVMALRNLDMLSICAIEGYCIQLSLSLALAADFRIVAKTARLASNTLKFGYMPDEGGHKLLVQHMGVGRAMDFMMRKRMFGGEQAVAAGLAHEAVEAEDLLPQAMALATEFAEGPQVAMRLLKRAIYIADDVDLPHAMEDIATRTAISDFVPDTGEGVRAWREKRKPNFNSQQRANAHNSEHAAVPYGHKRPKH